MRSSGEGVGSEEDHVKHEIATASDQVLVVRIARWDESALEEIYRRHSGPVCALAFRVLCDRQMADDVAQEVFLRLWKAPEKFDAQRGSLRTYLLTDTHGRAVDVVRARESRMRRERERDAFEDVVDDLEREVIDLSIAEQVKKAFDELPETERAALDLAYFKGCSYREVALRLQVPEGTIKSRIRSGLKRMGQLLPTSLDPSAIEEM
jgi:RNA polymerase sigma-70 factor (ECF subfamily)